MKAEDPIIARVRAARTEISAQLHDDPSKLLAYCERMDKEWREKRQQKAEAKEAAARLGA